MFFDIGGWWLSCDHMFRRFGTPFAVDWLAKNVNGYVYTTAVPPTPTCTSRAPSTARATGSGAARRQPSPANMGAYLDTVLPVYGEHFADWWRDRLVPEMEPQLRLPRGPSWTAPTTEPGRDATLLEDAIDVHDRHWKIHWMLNFAQLSATLNLRAVMEKTRGSVDEELWAAPELGLGPQLGLDRGALADEERGPRRRRLRPHSPVPAAGAIAAAHAAPPSEAGGSSAERSSRTSASSAGTRSGATEFHLPDGPREMEPVLELSHAATWTGLRLPLDHRGDAPRHPKPLAAILDGPQRRSAGGDAGRQRR
jgi:hypothetical protein